MSAQYIDADIRQKLEAGTIEEALEALWRIANLPPEAAVRGLELAVKMAVKRRSVTVLLPAVRCLTNVDSPGATDVLCDLLSHPLTSIRCKAIAALALRRDPSSIEALRVALGDDTPDVTFAAATTLRALAEVGSEPEELRAAASAAMQTVPAKAFLQRCGDAVDKCDARLRETIELGSSAGGVEEAESGLLQLVADVDLEAGTRIVALAALNELTDPPEKGSKDRSRKKLAEELGEVFGKRGLGWEFVLTDAVARLLASSQTAATARRVVQLAVAGVRCVWSVLPEAARRADRATAEILASAKQPHNVFLDVCAAKAFCVNRCPDGFRQALTILQDRMPGKTEVVHDGRSRLLGEAVEALGIGLERMPELLEQRDLELAAKLKDGSIEEWNLYTSFNLRTTVDLSKVRRLARSELARRDAPDGHET